MFESCEILYALSCERFNVHMRSDTQAVTSKTVWACGDIRVWMRLGINQGDLGGN